MTLHKCSCRDCLVETSKVLCQRCEQFRCDARGCDECHCPNAYALQSREPKRIT